MDRHLKVPIENAVVGYAKELRLRFAIDQVLEQIN